ncbi:MAG TPA: type I methionyl aminopeptidase [Gemmatimonadaceae bacterium]|nr:type I methionyl aminopeptidase [Gemmatimonadaceae bacterium]
MIKLKSARELEIMRAGGKILAATHAALRAAVRPGVTTAELDRLAETFIRDHAGATPAFKGLYGFPGSICASINEEIVHGIPSKKRALKEGDIISLDVGVGYKGLFTDAASTVPVGEIDEESRRLLAVTQASLEAGIKAATVGNQVGDIGAAVQAVVEKAGYSVVRELVGHGVGAAMHEEPQVPNYGKPHRGTKLNAGLTIAIEPMVNVGGHAVKTLADRWTIVTADASRSAHFEHTVAITENGPQVLTRA